MVVGDAAGHGGLLERAPPRVLDDGDVGRTLVVQLFCRAASLGDTLFLTAGALVVHEPSGTFGCLFAIQYREDATLAFDYTQY